MLNLGLLRRSSAGVYHLLPLALRSLEKLVGLIDGKMEVIGAAMPILTPASHVDENRLGCLDQG